MVGSSSLDEAPKFFRSWGVPVFGASFSSFSYFSLPLWVTMIDDLLVFLFLVSQRPRLKKRYQRRAERVKEYLESIKDFDELISPQSLFLHFLGSEPSTKVRKNLEIVKKSMCFFLFVFFFLLSLSLSLLFIYLLFKEWQLGLVSRNWLRPKRRKPRVAPSVVSCQRKRRVTPLRKILWWHLFLPTCLPSALPLPPHHWRWLPLVERRLGRRSRLVVSLFFPPFGMMLMRRL